MAELTRYGNLTWYQRIDNLRRRAKRINAGQLTAEALRLALGEALQDHHWQYESRAICLREGPDAMFEFLRQHPHYGSTARRMKLEA